MGLELDSHVVAAQARVVVRGDVDMASAPQLRRLLDELIDAGATEVVVDCRELDFLDSSGIGALVAARTRLGDGGALAIEHARPNVRKVLEVTGVDRDLDVR